MFDEVLPLFVTYTDDVKLKSPKHRNPEVEKKITISSGKLLNEFSVLLSLR